MRPQIVSPLTKRTLSQSFVGDGGTIGSLTQANVDTTGGAVTVLAPTSLYPSVEAAHFIVYDAGGVAGESAITVDGNGRLIDGEASFVLDVPGAAVAFVYDIATDGWKAAAVPLRDLVLGETMYPAQSLKAAVGIGGGGNVSRIQDPSLIGESAGTAWTLGNFTTALQFRVHRPLVLVGADVWVLTSVPRDIKITLWSALTVIMVTKTFAAVPAAAGRVRFMFDAPIAIPAVVNAGGPYRLAVYEMSGTEACGTAAVTTDLTAEIGGLRSHLIRPDVYSIAGGYTANDAYPGVSGGTTHYPICPAFSDDSRDDAPATLIS